MYIKIFKVPPNDKVKVYVSSCDGKSTWSMIELEKEFKMLHLRIAARYEMA